MLISQITVCQSLAALHKGSISAGPLISALAIGKAAIAGSCFTACQTSFGPNYFFLPNASKVFLFYENHPSPTSQLATRGCHNGDESPASCRPRPLAASTELPLWPPPPPPPASKTCWQKPKKNCFPCCLATGGKGRAGRRAGGGVRG